MPSTPPLNIRLSEQESKDVQEVAKMYKTSKSAVIRMCLEMFLEELRKRPSINLAEIVKRFEREGGNPDFGSGANPVHKPNRGRTQVEVPTPKKPPQIAEVFRPHHFFINCPGEIAAGKPVPPPDLQDGYAVTAPRKFPQNCYALRINGRSMEPEYPDGYYVVIRPLIHGEWPKKRQVYAWQMDDGEVTLKKLVYTKAGKPNPDGTPRKPTPHLISLNPEFPEVKVWDESSVKAIGEAVGCFATHSKP